MEFIEEDIDINDEQITDDLDVDLGPSSHSLDWKLNPNVECRVMLERMKSLHKVQRDSDNNGEAETEMSSPQSVDKSCGINRKLKLLVDVLKNCDKREECGLCEKYIQQLQQHLLTHGNNTGTAQERNSIETEPISLDPCGVPFDKEKLDVPMSHGDDTKNTDDGFVHSLTTGSDSEGEPSSQRMDPNKFQGMSISKGGKSKPFKCETCGKGFLTFYDLTQHKRIHNAETINSHLNPKILQTQKKGSNSNSEAHRKCFEDSNFLTRHERINKKWKAYTCDTCGKKFVGQWSLTLHKLVHAGVKSFKCGVCGKCFTNNTHLTTHKIVHAGEEQYRCELCGEFFTQLGPLTQHILAHGRETPHKCKACGKCFNFHSALVRHKVTHTRGKPYKCDVCGECFGSNAHLAKHKLVHTGVKYFKCGLCGKYFTQKGNLRAHIQAHTGERPHKCELCGKRYKYHSAFGRHKLIHAKQ